MRSTAALCALGICLLASRSARAQDSDGYRASIFVADGLALGVPVAVGILSGGASVSRSAGLLASVAPWFLTAPVVHGIGHGRWGSAAGSLAMRLAFAAGAVALTSTLADRAGRDPQNDCGSGCGFLAGAFLTIVTLPGVTVVDALALAGPRSRPNVKVVLAPLVGRSAGGLRVGGSF